MAGTKELIDQKRMWHYEPSEKAKQQGFKGCPGALCRITSISWPNCGDHFGSCFVIGSLTQERNATNASGEPGRTFWQADYFDRYIRNEEHYRRTLAYIENNPVKARLVAQAVDWSWSSARFRTMERGQPCPPRSISVPDWTYRGTKSEVPQGEKSEG